MKKLADEIEPKRSNIFFGSGNEIFFSNQRKRLGTLEIDF